MKNRFLLIAAMLISGIVILSWTADPKKTPPVAGENKMPADVATILENSCGACHGANGRAMAMSHLKLAQWNEYSAEKQADKAAEICKVITSGKMPPKGYLRDNPAKALSKSQIDSICAWSTGVKQ